jgi:hypothetical protein
MHKMNRLGFLHNPDEVEIKLNKVKLLFFICTFLEQVVYLPLKKKLTRCNPLRVMMLIYFLLNCPIFSNNLIKWT